MTPGLCRQCCRRIADADGVERCPGCGSPRLLAHAELHDLSIAHLDCDAFYAAVEKRDDPSLRDRPVVVGGGRRGVVSAACYVARLYGVRSAMPMFKALDACPHAVVIRPDMAKYAAAGRQVRALMRAVTPLVEPLSIDEAFLDLGARADKALGPAEAVIRLVRRVETEIGVTASIGLSYNKFLAKVASDMDKPRGFSVIGRAEAESFLAGRPVSLIWGVGPALGRTLARDGISTIGQLRTRDEGWLVARYGAIGRRLARFARGQDDRRVEPSSPTRSISAETTFDGDVADAATLVHHLAPLAETVARRLGAAGLAAGAVVLKLRTGTFETRTRSRRLADPTQRAEAINAEAARLLERELSAAPFRLIGVGAAALAPAAEADPPDLFGDAAPRPGGLALAAGGTEGGGHLSTRHGGEGGW